MATTHTKPAMLHHSNKKKSVQRWHSTIPFPFLDENITPSYVLMVFFKVWAVNSTRSRSNVSIAAKWTVGWGKVYHKIFQKYLLAIFTYIHVYIHVKIYVTAQFSKPASPLKTVWPNSQYQKNIASFKTGWMASFKNCWITSFETNLHIVVLKKQIYQMESMVLQKNFSFLSTELEQWRLYLMFSTKAARMAPFISHLGKSINISLPKPDVTVCSLVYNFEFIYTVYQFNFAGNKFCNFREWSSFRKN